MIEKLKFTLAGNNIIVESVRKSEVEYLMLGSLFSVLQKRLPNGNILRRDGNYTTHSF